MGSERPEAGCLDELYLSSLTATQLSHAAMLLVGSDSFRRPQVSTVNLSPNAGPWILDPKPTL